MITDKEIQKLGWELIDTEVGGSVYQLKNFRLWNYTDRKGHIGITKDFCIVFHGTLDTIEKLELVMSFIDCPTISFVEIRRKEDNKIITLQELINLFNEGKLEKSDKPYIYRHSEEVDKPYAWIHYQEIVSGAKLNEDIKESQNKVLWNK